MTSNNLSKRISDLSERLEELKAKCVSNPEYPHDILEGALESLQASIEELSSANKELINTQSALKESEENFRALSEASPSAILVYRGNRHLYVNPAAVSIFGYSKEELLTMDFLASSILTTKTW